MTYVRIIQAFTNKRIAERVKGGFYAQFSADCDAMCGPFSYLIRRKVKTKDCNRINIEFYDEHKASISSLYPLPIKWYFDVIGYDSLTNEQKAFEILRTTREACVAAGELMKWNVEPFNQAYDTLKSAGFTWEYQSKYSTVPNASGTRIKICTTVSIGGVELSAIIKPVGTSAVSRFAVGSLSNRYDYKYGVLPRLTWIEGDVAEIDGVICQLENNEFIRVGGRPTPY